MLGIALPTVRPVPPVLDSVTRPPCQQEGGAGRSPTSLSRGTRGRLDWMAGMVREVAPSLLSDAQEGATRWIYSARGRRWISATFVGATAPAHPGTAFTGPPPERVNLVIRIEALDTRPGNLPASGNSPPHPSLDPRSGHPPTLALPHRRSPAPDRRMACQATGASGLSCPGTSSHW